MQLEFTILILTPQCHDIARANLIKRRSYAMGFNPAGAIRLAYHHSFEAVDMMRQQALSSVVCSGRVEPYVLSLLDTRPERVQNFKI